MTVETMDNNNAMMMTEDHQDQHGVELSSNATTIDPSIISSRIRQSASLQKEEQMVVNDGSAQPHFPKLSAVQASGNRSEYRRVRCPPHRYTPLREYWEQILTPLVEYLKLQVRHIGCVVSIVCYSAGIFSVSFFRESYWGHEGLSYLTRLVKKIAKDEGIPESSQRDRVVLETLKPIESRKPRSSMKSWGGC